MSRAPASREASSRERHAVASGDTTSGIRMSELCTHLDQVTLEALPPSVAGCEDCLREGGKWLHLRICLTCGHVGCCEDSPSRHATAHFQGSGHALIRSLEPGEEWSWCYVDELGMLIPDIRGQTRIPPS